MGYLGKKPATQGKDAGPALKLDDISSNFDGLTKTFSLSVDGTSISPHVNNISVYLSGVYQIPGNSYSLSGSYIVFTGAPSSSLDFHGAILGSTRIIVPDNDTIETAAFTDNTRSAISGSFRTELSGSHVKLVGGGVSGSSTSLGSFGNVVSATHITASGNISASGTVFADNFESAGGNDTITFTDDLNITGSLEVQGDVTVSEYIYHKGDGDTHIRFADNLVNLVAGGKSAIKYEASTGKIIINNTNENVDFHVMAEDNSEILATDAANNRLGINTTTPTKALTVTGDISGSGDLNVNGNITGSSVSASIGKFTTVDIDGGTAVLSGGTITGNLSVGGTLTAQEVHTEFESASVLFTSGSTRFGNDTTDVHRVTGSMDISGSLKIPHGNVTVTDTLTSTNIGAFNLTGKLTAGSTEIEGSAFDINGGTIDGITSLTAAGDLDIGAHDFRAATLTADGLTSGRVVIAGSSGLLSNSSNLTFATDTLSTTNLTATGTFKNMALVSGSSVSTGSFGGVFSAGVSRFDGRVGIGTSSPSESLEVFNATSPAIQLNDGNDYKGIFRLAGNDLEIRGSSGTLELYNGSADGDSSTLAMSIDNVQNIGIGATPTTFHATLTGVQIGGNAILQHETSAGAGKTFKIAQNVREEITSGDFTYISTDEASLIELNSGGVNILKIITKNVV